MLLTLLISCGSLGLLEIIGSIRKVLNRKLPCRCRKLRCQHIFIALRIYIVSVGIDLLYADLGSAESIKLKLRTVQRISGVTVSLLKLNITDNGLVFHGHCPDLASCDITRHILCGDGNCLRLGQPVARRSAYLRKSIFHAGHKTFDVMRLSSADPAVCEDISLLPSQL